VERKKRCEGRVLFGSLAKVTRPPELGGLGPQDAMALATREDNGKTPTGRPIGMASMSHLLLQPKKTPVLWHPP
jgi:hypothetical protein